LGSDQIVKELLNIFLLIIRFTASELTLPNLRFDCGKINGDEIGGNLN